MRIVEPWVKVEKFDGKEIMKRIERACRTCYRSEGKITEEKIADAGKYTIEKETVIKAEQLHEF